MSDSVEGKAIRLAFKLADVLQELNNRVDPAAHFVKETVVEIFAEEANMKVVVDV